MANSPTRKRQPTAQQKLLTGYQAEQIYGIPERSLYDLRARGVLPVVCIPGTRRHWYRREDLDQLIEQSLRKGA
jgi:hypothetical protein